MVIATKVSGLGQDVVRGGAKITAETLRTAVENSLRRLRTDYIDLYQLHVPNRSHYHFRRVWSFDPSGQVKAETVAGMAECLETLAALRNEGKIRHFGLSNETTWGIAQWLRLADDGVGPRLLTIQNEYSLLCRYYDTDLAELAVNEGVTLLAYSPAGAGLLSGKYRPDYSPEGSRRALNGDLGGRCTPRVWPAVDAYISIAREAKHPPRDDGSRFRPVSPVSRCPHRRGDQRRTTRPCARCSLDHTVAGDTGTDRRGVQGASNAILM